MTLHILDDEEDRAELYALVTGMAKAMDGYPLYMCGWVTTMMFAFFLSKTKDPQEAIKVQLREICDIVDAEMADPTPTLHEFLALDFGAQDRPVN